MTTLSCFSKHLRWLERGRGECRLCSDCFPMPSLTLSGCASEGELFFHRMPPCSPLLDGSIVGCDSLPGSHV